MSYPDHVIDAIDAALEDCTVGPDAMRWAPPDEEPAALDAWRGRGDLLVVQDEGHAWTREQVEGWQRCINGMLERQSHALAGAFPTALMPPRPEEATRGWAW
ncbi:hypothetical protein [Streptomonospora nanhaiensis]|uniref:hypothetical protein n=1 Tax=Streptomonospora nanhaiensis TaxID=1323731 RepID=UPI001C3823F9|nr:hypothetical protein [Streptomonospora nanhaiensis]MBV2364239.1 hypothetical protein [Streptomonospora nanhaiensis]